MMDRLAAVVAVREWLAKSAKGVRTVGSKERTDQLTASMRITDHSATPAYADADPAVIQARRRLL